MNLTIQEGKMSDFAECMPSVLQTISVESSSEIYEQNRHRIYSLAFWMTDNELAAEELMTHTFCRAFVGTDVPSAEAIDRALISELRHYMPVGKLTLACGPCDRVLSVRRNTLRVDLERAVIQLPNTEKLILLMHDVESYDHSRIARLLGITEVDSLNGLHQARLRMRELLANYVLSLPCPNSLLNFWAPRERGFFA
jgi:RNA polymerase sigma-70 factor, ECF subfamily